MMGIAIGNGALSRFEQFNSLMTMLYYRGIYGHEMFFCAALKSTVQRL
ncbi:unnamed protein product [Gongylonema pulchrum]|uniref:Uncharacterized protein n=1 Tax=Gongylonema pulchrum TaxID=637853 RepID=A0A3P6RCC2_9BILA|nr:unnamed protein product [Gongylonema pulchrum]